MPVLKNCSAAMLILSALTITSLPSCSQVSSQNGGGSPERLLLEDLGNGVCLQHSSGLMWQISTSPRFPTLEEARRYAESLELAGYDDWRLPTREECRRFNEQVELRRSNCPITMTRPHWVMDDAKEKPGHWEDYPLCGGSEFRWVKGKHGTVRAVRP